MNNEIPLFDALRSAIVAYRDGIQDSQELSDRQIAKTLGISNAQLSRWISGQGKTIRAETVKYMLPYLRKYLSEDQIRYIKNGGEGDYSIAIICGHENETGDIFTSLKIWLEHKASQKDRELIFATAERCGFSRPKN